MAVSEASTTKTVQKPQKPLAKLSAVAALPAGQSSSATSARKTAFKATAKRWSNSSFWSSCNSHLENSPIKGDRLVAVLEALAERRVEDGVAARVVGVLEFVEAPVEVAAGEELLVRAALAQLAVVEDEYLVGALDGREAVRDDDGGAVAQHPLDGPLDELLGLRVDGAGRLVEDEERRVEGERAREGDELLLADGEARAALAHLGLVALGQALDEAVGVHLARGPGDAVLRHVPAAEADVARDRAAEEEHVLQDDREVLP